MTKMTKIAIFKGKRVRKILFNGEWWFSVTDVCGALTDSADAGAYWRKLKQRLSEEGSEVVTFCHGLKNENSKGVAKLKSDAKAGGARKKLEERLGRSVVTKQNFLRKPERKKIKSD